MHAYTSERAFYLIYIGTNNLIVILIALLILYAQKKNNDKNPDFVRLYNIVRLLHLIQFV